MENLKNSIRLRIGLLLAIGLPGILGLGLVVSNQLNTLSIADDYITVQPVTIDEAAYKTASRDMFEFLQVELKGDRLTIEVFFSGSHTGHDFELIGTGEFMESWPIQTQLVLSHDSKGDVGEALLTKRRQDRVGESYCLAASG